ncbi:MAG: hypothetical protein CMK92_05175 [Pseudomonas sp.]|nr:hypothetical protein [Pseudomonas sp.]
MEYEYLFDEGLLTAFYPELLVEEFPDALLFTTEVDLKRLKDPTLVYLFTWHFLPSTDTRIALVEACGRPYINDPDGLGAWVGIHVSEGLAEGWELFADLKEQHTARQWYLADNLTGLLTK